MLAKNRMCKGKPSDESALIYERPRRTAPPPAIAVFGTFISVLSGVCWFGLIAEGTAELRQYPSVGVALAILPLGLFFIYYGYRDRPVYRFYSTEFHIVAHDKTRVISYHAITNVMTNHVNFTLDYLIPIGTSHTLLIYIKSDEFESEQVSITVHTSTESFPPFNRVVEAISREATP